jgi:hypothetical protein
MLEPKAEALNQLGIDYTPFFIYPLQSARGLPSQRHCHCLLDNLRSSPCSQLLLALQDYRRTSTS